MCRVLDKVTIQVFCAIVPPLDERDSRDAHLSREDDSAERRVCDVDADTGRTIVGFVSISNTTTVRLDGQQSASDSS
jgi:hypothetical protein